MDDKQPRIPRPRRSVTIFTVKVTRKKPIADTLADLSFQFADYTLATTFIRGLPEHLDHQLDHAITHTDVDYCLRSLSAFMPK